MLELQRVGDGGDHVGIAAEDRDSVARLAGPVPFAEQVVGRARAEPVPRPMNLTCTGVPASEAGELRDRLLDGDQVGDDVDCLGPLGVGVRPARELLQVVADARYLYGALTLDGDRRRGPRPLLPMRAICTVRSRSTETAGAVHVRVRAMACRSRSESGTLAASALASQSARSAGDTRAAANTVRRSGIGAHRHGGTGAGPRPLARQGGGTPGVRRGARSAPSPARCTTSGRLAHQP